MPLPGNTFKSARSVYVANNDLPIETEPLSKKLKKHSASFNKRKEMAANKKKTKKPFKSTGKIKKSSKMNGMASSLTNNSDEYKNKSSPLKKKNTTIDPDLKNINILTELQPIEIALQKKKRNKVKKQNLSNSQVSSVNGVTTKGILNGVTSINNKNKIQKKVSNKIKDNFDKKMAKKYAKMALNLDSEEQDKIYEITTKKKIKLNDLCKAMCTIEDKKNEKTKFKNEKVKNNKSKVKNEIVKVKKIKKSKDSSKVKVYSPNEVAVCRWSSIVYGLKTLYEIIQPITVEDFFENYWEKKPLLVKRKDKKHYRDLFSTSDFDDIIREQNVQFTKNLDVTSYINDKRETHNPEGRAHGPVVWDFYNSGCSLRLLNPQTFHRPVWEMLSNLQECFGSFCGANVYLTPPGTQGFAPHWDDIEAFIMQLEGKKRWKVYAPRCENEKLPRVSSANLKQDEVSDPLLDVVLEEGDLLYFPRGFIHQGHTVDDEHSLHITISSYQKTSWSDYFEKLLPMALASASSQDVKFREGLPLNYLSYMGCASQKLCKGYSNYEKKKTQREQFKSMTLDLIDRLKEIVSDDDTIDKACDLMGKDFIHDALPPVLSNEEEACSVFEAGEVWCPKRRRVINQTEITPEDYVRLLKANCMRLVVDDECAKIYYNLENSREYHEVESQYLEVPDEQVDAIKALINAYPDYIMVEDLPLKTLEDQMGLVNGLWERGLIMTADPPKCDDSEIESDSEGEVDDDVEIVESDGYMS